MHQIDAAVALRILIDAGPETKWPITRAMALIEERARNGELSLWGFRGSAPVPEPIPVQHICALEFDWLAGCSKVDDELGEAALITPEDGRASPCECVWSDLRFSREEIEGIISPTATDPQKRKRRQRERERAKLGSWRDLATGRNTT